MISEVRLTTFPIYFREIIALIISSLKLYCCGAGRRHGAAASSLCQRSLFSLIFALLQKPQALARLGLMSSLRTKWPAPQVDPNFPKLSSHFLQQVVIIYKQPLLSQPGGASLELEGIRLFRLLTPAFISSALLTVVARHLPGSMPCCLIALPLFVSA